ncbi:MAG: GNAT family N-acetyltransferase [Planctomycetota bacterium]|jgi:phosphinothricin acetyltransferase
MDIRLATLDDVAAILEISNHYAAETPANFAIEPESPADWEATFRATHEQYPWLVAVADGEVVGWAKASPWKGRCAYAYSAEVSVYIRPTHHRRGIGRALYDRLLATLRAQGYRSAIGGITLPNDASVALHESFGMERAAVFRSVGWKFERWHDVGYWQVQFDDGPPPDRMLRVDEVADRTLDP